MADENQIIVSIVGDISGLKVSIAEANTTIDALRGQVSGLTSKLDTLTPSVTGAAAGVSRLENTAAMATGKLVGMESGIGMLGGQLGRLASAAGIAGPFLLAMIPLAALAGGLILYDKWQEHLLALSRDQAEVNLVLGKQGDELLVLDERYAGITGGSMAQYARELADIRLKTLDLSPALSVIDKLLEQQEGRWTRMASGVLVYLANLALVPAKFLGIVPESTPATATYSSKDAEKFMADVQEGITASTDKSVALGVAMDVTKAKLKELDDLEAKGTYTKELEDSRAALARFYEYLKDQAKKSADEQRNIQAEAHKKGIEEQIRGDEAYAVSLAKSREEAATPATVGTVSQAWAARNAAIEGSKEERDARLKANEDMLADGLESQQAYENKRTAINDAYVDREYKAGEELQKRLREIRDKGLEEDLKQENATVDATIGAWTRGAEKKAEEAAKGIAARGRTEETATTGAARTVQVEAQVGLVSRLSEQQQLLAIYTKAKADEEARVTAGIAVEIELQKELAAIGKGPGTVEYGTSVSRMAEMKEQLAAITAGQDRYSTSIRDTNLKLQEMHMTWGKVGQTMKAEAQDEIAKLKNMRDHFDLLDKTMASGISQWVVGQKTLAQAMREVASAIVQQIVQEVILIGLREIESHLPGMGDQKKKDQQMVGEKAGLAAAAEFASVMVAEPFPLNVALAPAMAAAAYAEAMAFGSFQKGGIHPGTGLYMGHAQEMTLPAHLSTFIQRAAAHEGGVGGGTNIYGGIHYAPVISEPFNPQKHGTEMVSFLKSKISRMGVA
jgi:hypothetical protein